MTTAAETERAPESKQPSVSGDPPEAAAGNSQDSDVLVCIDRLQTLCPAAFKEAQSGLDAHGFWPAVLQTIERQVSAKGYGLLADMLEFAEAWKPGAVAQQTKSGHIEQLKAIVRADLVFDRLRDLCTAAQALLDPHLPDRDDAKPSLSPRDCKTVHRLAESSYYAIENAQTDLAEYALEFSNMVTPNEDAEPSEQVQLASETPAATLDLDDIRERFRNIAGLVQAAYLCEGSFTHGSGDKDAIEDYFTAISGSISVAASECRRLLADLDAKGGVQ